MKNIVLTSKSGKYRLMSRINNEKKLQPSISYRKDGFEVHNETVTLCHEEHNEIEIPPGKYVVRIVREFDHIAGRSRNVAD